MLELNLFRLVDVSMTVDKRACSADALNTHVLRKQAKIIYNNVFALASFNREVAEARHIACLPDFGPKYSDKSLSWYILFHIRLSYVY